MLGCTTHVSGGFGLTLVVGTETTSGLVFYPHVPDIQACYHRLSLIFAVRFASPMDKGNILHMYTI